MHFIIEKVNPSLDTWILIVLIPVFAVVMALLALRENAVYQWGSRLDDARMRVNELMRGSTARKSRSIALEDPSLCTCWDTLGCDKTDCPAFGLEHARCWLIAGTFCRGKVQGKFARKLQDCRLCEVYKAATADPVKEITENFYAMNYLLGEREEQLEKAYRDAKNRSEKLAGLVSLSEAALSSVHLSEMMQNLLGSAASFVGADFGVVSLADPAGEVLAVGAIYGLQPESQAQLTMRAGEGIIGRAFAGRYIAVSEDLSTDSRVTNLYLHSLGAKTLISLPLLIREQMLGMLTLGTFTPHQYTDEEKDSLVVAADRIAMAIENVQLAGELGRDREQFELFTAIARDVGAGGGISGVYDSFVKHASSLIEFDQASLALLHPETDDVEIVAMKTSAARSWMGRGLRLPKDALPVGKVVESRRPLVRDEIAGDEYPTDKLLIEEGIRSTVLFPLISEGNVIGAVNLGSFKPAAFSREDVELLEPVTRQLGLVLDNARLLQEARRSSTVDSLTGLNNHSYFYDAVSREVSRSQRFKRPLALLILDIDGLKSFNDRYGHANGDVALREIARVLKSEVRQIDTVARYGGDEFSVLLPEVSVVDGNSEAAYGMYVAERIRDAISAAPIPVDGGDDLTLSIGIAEYPSHAPDAEQLLERAGWALREAKSLGKDRIVVAPVPVPQVNPSEPESNQARPAGDRPALREVDQGESGVDVAGA